MPSKKHYDSMPSDENDLRIPMHSEDTFRHGISYFAKYIGSLDIPKPTSRLEIVAAMRRIRFEFKAKGVKKMKVSLEISLDGVKVSLRRKKKKKDWPIEDASSLLMHHPVYRIFYVSHDSQDMKIFSYIARDGSSNVFRCNVFKTNKKSQAMRIVRTVGQAFEVCNKIPHQELGHEIPDDLSSSDDHSSKKADTVSEMGADQSQDDGASSLPESPKNPEQIERPIKLELEKTTGILMEEAKFVEPKLQQQQPQQLPQQQQQQTVVSQPYQQQPMNATLTRVTPTTPLALHHEVLLLKQQLEQQQQQTQAAFAQVKLLKDQLAAETAARLEAQTRTHQLLVHNKELLDHIQTLVVQMQELEGKVQSSNPNIQQGSAPPLAQMSGLPTLREVDCMEESNPTVDLYSTTMALQQQLQQQQQQYSMLLAQAAHQQQQNLLPQLLLANLNAAALFPFQSPSLNPPSTPRFPSPNSSFTSLSQTRGSPTQLQNASSASGGCPFILPLAEVDKSGSHDSGLGSGHLASGAGAGNSRPMDVIRRLQLIGEDSNASAASLQSCDSDRLRIDSSSLESMANGSKPSLPTLHQQLENLRFGYDAAEERGTLRRNAPFITRSTSEKVPHRNEILAQVQRTAWARHTTK